MPPEPDDDEEVRWDHYPTAYHHTASRISERQWWQHGITVPVEWLHPEDDPTPMPDSRWY